MNDDAFRAAVESAETYKAAAIAVGEHYCAVYARAKKLGVVPKSVAPRKPRARRSGLPAPQSQPLLPRPRPQLPPLAPIIQLRDPAPEPTRPVLSPWIPMPDGIAEKADVVSIRIDQRGRVRAAISEQSDGCATWVVRDVTGAVVGKIGLRIGIHPGQARREAEEGVDEVLVKLGWLPADRAVPVEPCAMPAPACTPKGPDRSPDMLGALCVAFGAAAEIALPAGWTEEDFVKVARWCFRREQKGRAA